jgi:ATP-dependent helicase HrpA
MTQAKLRRFCRDHFLSYPRMREWRDIHAQLMDVLEQRAMTSGSHRSAFDGAAQRATSPRSAAFGTPAYRAIHRSILAGLLGNIAHLDEENGGYKATHDRAWCCFPARCCSVARSPEAAPPRPSRGRRRGSRAEAPRWIMAAEMWRPRGCTPGPAPASIRLWALDLGAHLLRISHSEPFWNAEGPRDGQAAHAALRPRTRARAVSYGKIDPAHATEIFIREGLVNDTITWPLDFLAHNREVREKVWPCAHPRTGQRLPQPRRGRVPFLRARLLPPATGAVPDAPLRDQRRRRTRRPRARARGAPSRVSSMMEPDDLRDPGRSARRGGVSRPGCRSTTAPCRSTTPTSRGRPTTA